MINIIEKYIHKMFGSEIDEEGKRYINVYRYEWRGVVREIEIFLNLKMSKPHFEGCMIYSLCGILTDENLNKFREDGLIEFAQELYDYKKLNKTR